MEPQKVGLFSVQGIYHKVTQSSRFLLMDLFPNLLGRGNFDIPSEHSIYGDVGTRPGEHWRAHCES